MDEGCAATEGIAVYLGHDDCLHNDGQPLLRPASISIQAQVVFDKMPRRYNTIVYPPHSNGAALFVPDDVVQEAPEVSEELAKHISELLWPPQMHISNMLCSVPSAQSLVDKSIQSCFSPTSCGSWDAVPHRPPWPPPMQFVIQADSTQPQPLPWPSFSSYAASVQFNTSIAVVLHGLGFLFCWPKLTQLRLCHLWLSDPNSSDGVFVIVKGIFQCASMRLARLHDSGRFRGKAQIHALVCLLGKHFIWAPWWCGTSLNGHIPDKFLFLLSWMSSVLACSLVVWCSHLHMTVSVGDTTSSDRVHLAAVVVLSVTARIAKGDWLHLSVPLNSLLLMQHRGVL